MGEKQSHLYWDSCVFIRFIIGNVDDPFLSQLRQHVLDAQEGRTKIYYSTISFAEIRPQFFNHSSTRTIEDFFDDFQGAFHGIGPSPDILISAGKIRDHNYNNPAAGPPSKKNGSHKRALGTPDAIHLMTCLHLRDTYNLTEIKFHTFDEGKGSTWEGKCVPLLSFEKWITGISDPLVTKVASLPREKPIHSRPALIPLSV